MAEDRQARSAAVQELMGKMPHWMVRSGIMLIGILLLCLLTIAWFVRYPDAVNARITITQGPASYEVTGEVPAADTWRIRAGQKVLIRLTAYPYDEFGMLEGTVGEGGELTGDHYKVKIQLDQQLCTNTGKMIPRQPKMEGRGEILLEEQRVLQRIFGKMLIFIG